MVEKLLRLNQEFYATYAHSFAATRHSVQPGVQRLLPQIMQANVVLDLGCGNGNLAELLKSEGFCGSYVGVDENDYFLEQAAAAVQDAASGSYTFRQGSLANCSWLELVDHADAICSFAALHHRSGFETAPAVVFFGQCHTQSQWSFFLSCWQVLGNQRLEKHLVPWSPLGITDETVGQADLLMDWRADPGKPAKLRYVHHFSPSELHVLGESQGLILQDEFFQMERKAIWVCTRSGENLGSNPGQHPAAS